MNIGIAGASGYTGLELIRILSFHDKVEINQISSRKFSGKKLRDVFPFISGKYGDLVFKEDLNLSDSDIFFLCLPHEPSVDYVFQVLENGKKVIDLSGAYRLKNKENYIEYYGFEHKYPNLLERSVYGLPEIFREEIKNAELIANPGCYPTATLIGLYPAVKEGIILENEAVVNALSGISGAGREPKQQFHYPEAYGDSYPYNPIKHRHIPEMEDILKAVGDKDFSVRFTPHILPVSRGMISTIHFKTNLSRDDLKEVYRDYYKDEPFVRFCENPPHIKHVIGSNFTDIFIDKDERTGYGIVVTAIDNLCKGASSQAVQNLNLIAGFDETYKLLDLSQSGIVFP